MFFIKGPRALYHYVDTSGRHFGLIDMYMQVPQEGTELRELNPPEQKVLDGINNAKLVFDAIVVKLTSGLPIEFVESSAGAASTLLRKD